MCYWEENIGKQIEIDFLTVLLSIPLNKLPWVERSSTAVSVAVVLLTVVPELPVVRIPAIPFLSVTLPARSLFICLRLSKTNKILIRQQQKFSLFLQKIDFQKCMRRVWNWYNAMFWNKDSFLKHLILISIHTYLLLMQYFSYFLIL